MVPFTYDREFDYNENTICYVNMQFFGYTPNKIYPKVYYYKDSQKFWIEETDEVLTWQVL